MKLVKKHEEDSIILALRPYARVHMLTHGLIYAILFFAHIKIYKREKVKKKTNLAYNVCVSAAFLKGTKYMQGDDKVD